MTSIFPTGDGSKTLFSDRFGEHYHSTYGAVNESNHIFIDAGYRATDCDPVSVLEAGFGTGLNAFLTLREAGRLQRHTYYESIELFPVDISIIRQISSHNRFMEIHDCPWEQESHITSYFTLLKRNADLSDVTFDKGFDVIYFDAFSPAVQPELWQPGIFLKLYNALNDHGVITTYCAKGEVRRTLQNTGFRVERLPGPKGKREILRGRK